MRNTINNNKKQKQLCWGRLRGHKLLTPVRSLTHSVGVNRGQLASDLRPCLFHPNRCILLQTPDPAAETLVPVFEDLCLPQNICIPKPCIKTNRKPTSLPFLWSSYTYGKHKNTVLCIPQIYLENILLVLTDTDISFKCLLLQKLHSTVCITEEIHGYAMVMHRKGVLLKGSLFWEHWQKSMITWSYTVLHFLTQFIHISRKGRAIGTQSLVCSLQTL